MKLGGEIGRGRRVEQQVVPGNGLPVEDESVSFARLMQTLLLAQFIGHEVLRQRLALVPMDERVNPATRAARGDAQQPLGGGLAEVHRKIRDDQEMIFLRDVPGLLVVFGNGLRIRCADTSG